MPGLWTRGFQESGYFRELSWRGTATETPNVTLSRKVDIVAHNACANGIYRRAELNRKARIWCECRPMTDRTRSPVISVGSLNSRDTSWGNRAIGQSLPGFGYKDRGRECRYCSCPRLGIKRRLLCYRIAGVLLHRVQMQCQALQLAIGKSHGSIGCIE